MNAPFPYKQVQISKVAHAPTNPTKSETVLRDLSDRAVPRLPIRSVMNHLRPTLSKMDPNDPDEDTLDSIYAFVAQEDPEVCRRLLGANMFSVLLSWFCSTPEIRRKISFVFVELARQNVLFCEFVSVHGRLMCDQLADPVLRAPLLVVFAIAIESFPSICVELHRRRVLDLLTIGDWSEEDDLSAAACFLVSLCRANLLIPDGWNEIGFLCDVCRFMVSFRIELLNQAAFVVMRTLLVHGVRLELLFDSEMMERISRLASKTQCMDLISDVMCEVCQISPDFADQMLEETTIFAAFARFGRLKNENLSASMEFLIAVAGLGLKWCQEILDAELIQSVSLPKIENSSHREKASVLRLFTILGSQCPGEVSQCHFIGEFLANCLDFAQSEGAPTDFVLLFLTMLSQMRDRCECLQTLDDRTFRAWLEELQFYSDNEIIRAMSNGILRDMS
jgi:hypothetical protein